jgi:O-acetyl-ADP-ribose deacetylase
VIHVLGPVHGRDVPSDELLAACYRRALARAEEAGLRSIGLPAVSTGAFGYPLAEAAEVALGTVRDEAPGLRSVRLVRFVLFDRRALEAHERALAGLG